MPIALEQFEADGVAIVPNVLHESECERIAALIGPVRSASGGTRCLLTEVWCAGLARQLLRHSALSHLFAPGLAAVQCTYFEKSALRNWLVPLHQDLSIPVAERVDTLGPTGWATKQGSLFVHAPNSLLASLVAVRVHLEPCMQQDGPLRVVPGSHRYGRLTPEAAARLRSETGETTCAVGAGSALVMRPLVLHSSSKATGSSRRRVLHFLLGPRELTHGLRWQHVVYRSIKMSSGRLRLPTAAVHVKR